MAKDQLPTTTDERIKVKLHEPQLGKNNDVSTDENGHLIWKLRLEPGKEVRLYYYYTIEFPAEKDIVLLNQ
jgi:putative component of toxin-antitoxin plasmid stabilization module